MKLPILAAGMLVAAGVVAQAREAKPADVMVYVSGASGPPSSVDYGARATITWIFARIGVRLLWRDGKVETNARVGRPVVIQVRFAAESQGKTNRDALAYALPFSDGTAAITVMYDRVHAIAGRLNREQPILAHVLAHEIGHVLERTNRHAEAGIMKAHWSGQDYDAMEKKPLDFTSLDVELIREGLKQLKARKAEAPPKSPR